MQALKFSNPEKIEKEIKQEISNIKDGRYVRRLDAVLLIAKGKSAYEVAEIFDYSPRSLHCWINAIEKYKDFRVLKDSLRSGRPGKLNKEQRDELRGVISQSPRESGYGYARWDGKLLSSHIHKSYGISLGVRRCQKLFHELGFSYRRPRKMTYGSSKESKEDFKKK